jgi:leader peptidase (prepilin peptidase)/N-methyltransferase
MIMADYPLFDLLQQYFQFWLISAALISLLIGSFLNVVIVRLPKVMQHEWQQECRALLKLSDSDQQASSPALASIAWPGSHCPECQTPLKAWHNIPVISYLWLQGKCAFCNTKISPRYPLVELLTAGLGLIIAWGLGPSLATVMALVLMYVLVALTFIDLEHKLLPDQLTLPLMWLGLVVNSFGLFTPLQDAFWGGVAGYMSLWLVYWGFRIVTGKHGMGYGDFKLLAALGAWLGWQALPIIVLVSAVTGILVGLALRFRPTPSSPEMPFGPFLSVGGLTYLLWGEQLWRMFEL